MLQTEYVRNLNANYERVLLDKKPEEKRYQYCILSRGGIRGLLPCSLRYMNGLAYLYYDISSKQNVAQLFGTRPVTREWMKDFLWSVQQIRQEMDRFLLDTRNILWNCEQIFQDLESNQFFFLYIPYYQGENSFLEVLDFLVEHADYNDDILVECVYHMYEQVENCGEAYLQAQIFEDAKALNRPIADTVPEEKTTESEAFEEAEEESRPDEVKEPEEKKKRRDEKKGILGIFDGKRHKSREMQEEYRREMQRAMNGYAVAEEDSYDREEDYGRTIYIEEKTEEEACMYRLYTPEDRLIAEIIKPASVIGKRKGEADVLLDDPSVSRMHARIMRERDNCYLEDLNSTNGTFKNGLRLQPYEKKKLEPGDEVKCGRVLMVFR